MRKIEELNFEGSRLGKVRQIGSIAGNGYLAHADQINKKLEQNKRKNADAYRKACFCPIG